MDADLDVGRDRKLKPNCCFGISAKGRSGGEGIWVIWLQYIHNTI